MLSDLSIPAPRYATVGGDDERGSSSRALIDRENMLHRRIRSTERSNDSAIL